jgi:hypothetical protein
MANHTVANNREFEFAHFCLKIDVYALNISPCNDGVLMQIKALIYLPTRWYFPDLTVFFTFMVLSLLFNHLMVSVEITDNQWRVLAVGQPYRLLLNQERKYPPGRER